MKFNVKTPIFASIAIASGVIVLLGYFIQWSLLVDLRNIFLNWSVILAAVALFVGILNLLRVHWGKFKARQPGGIYSLVLIGSLVLTLGLAIIFGPTHSWAMWLFKYVQTPIEASLMAMLAIILAYACARLYYRRLNLLTLLFGGTVVVVLAVTAASSWFDLLGLGTLRDLLIQAWTSVASGGARGILLGVALGTVATGLRVLMGADRPYGG